MRLARALALAALALTACGTAERPPPRPGASDTPSPRVDEPPADDLSCHPVSSCLCWVECALLRVGATESVRLDSEGEERFAHGPAGHEACDPDGACGPGFDSTSVDCDETCAPSRAPFSCRRVPEEPIDGTGAACERVEP